MNTYELCTDLDKNADSYSLNLGLCLKCLAFVTSSPGDTDTVFNFYVSLLILERETLNVDWLPLALPQRGAWPATFRFIGLRSAP